MQTSAVRRLPPTGAAVPGAMGGRSSPSPSASPARKPAAGSRTPLRVLLHSHSWSHCDGVAIRYKAHAQQLRTDGHWVGLSLSAAEGEEVVERMPAWLSPDGASESCLLCLPDAARVPCSDGPMMPMGSLRNLSYALAFVLRERPDVIHATFDSHAVSWLLVARLAGVPLYAQTITVAEISLGGLSAC